MPLVFYDEKIDIALLDFKESSKKIKGLKTGNSDHIDFGEKVYAIPINDILNYIGKQHYKED